MSTAPSPRSGLSSYLELGPIGEGTFGKVSKIRRISDGEVLVWKELYYGTMSEKEKQQLVSEVNILRELNHKNVVRYFDRIIDREKKKIYIVMEYCSGGDLASLIKGKINANQNIDEEFIWKILGEIASALFECHRKSNGSILHRDLKPGNIFLDHDGCAKLGDFGLARILKDSADYAKTHVGTPYYMSPEQVKESFYNHKSDIWSLGAIMYELCALSPPFKATNHLALAMKIQQGKFSRIPMIYSETLEKSIRSMLQVDPTKRPTVEQILSWPKVQAVLANSPRAAIENKENIPNAGNTANLQVGVAPLPSAMANIPVSAAALPPPVSGSSAAPNAGAVVNGLPVTSASAALQQLANRKKSEELLKREIAVEMREKKVKDKEAELAKREKEIEDKWSALNAAMAQWQQQQAQQIKFAPSVQIAQRPKELQIPTAPQPPTLIRAYSLPEETAKPDATDLYSKPSELVSQSNTRYSSYLLHRRFNSLSGAAPLLPTPTNGNSHLSALHDSAQEKETVFFR